MRLFDYMGTQRTSSFDGGIEVVHLEPQQDSMPTWRRVRIDKIRVMLFVPGMELKDQVAVTEHPIVGIPMLMLRECVGSQQMLVPAAAGPYVTHGNQRLRLNPCLSRRRILHFFSQPMFRYCGSASFSNCLPTFAPVNSRIIVFGAFSSPCCKSTWFLSFPAAYHLDISAIASG